ncbi:MAG TPA: hypothetical protein VK735_39550 [Pseudonocardia sp.]|uniref:hypothetical protein n=1 Tax=Pseudonocardia sp. TaxID=60912 RepID=UPI002CFC635F|nr:hypothetical protein [Pseudonocardia sp.]HTF53578.1 hypothetical protein [Pseudonocardia sp.]
MIRPDFIVGETLTFAQTTVHGYPEVTLTRVRSEVITVKGAANAGHADSLVTHQGFRVLAVIGFHTAEFDVHVNPEA